MAAFTLATGSLGLCLLAGLLISALRRRPSAALQTYRSQTSISPPRKACACHGIACAPWQSAFAPTVTAAARSTTEMRLGRFTQPTVGSITGALTGVMTFTALCLVASDIRALIASAGEIGRASC